MTLPRDILGLDVAKGWIDVFSLATGARQRITTAPAALARFAGAATGALVVFEASGAASVRSPRRWPAPASPLPG